MTRINPEDRTDTADSAEKYIREIAAGGRDRHLKYMLPRRSSALTPEERARYNARMREVVGVGVSVVALGLLGFVLGGFVGDGLTHIMQNVSVDSSMADTARTVENAFPVVYRAAGAFLGVSGGLILANHFYKNRA